MLEFMILPFLACLVLIPMHTYLGIHVVERKVIFVDLAMAQIAAFGGVVALLFGVEHEAWLSYALSLGFTFAGAGIFALTRTRNDRVPQEAIIGVVYVAFTALSVLALSRSPEGAEHIKEMLVGGILFVSSADIQKTLALYLALGAAHFIFRRRFFNASHQHDAPITASLRLWDFFFYASFGLVVASSVKIGGVLQVFTFLIVPALAAILFFTSFAHRLLFGVCFSILASIAGLYLSVQYDLPTGAIIVAVFAAFLLLFGLVGPFVKKPRVRSEANAQRASAGCGASGG